MATSLKKFLSFYARFTPSYSGIGYVTRRLFWKPFNPDFSGQKWLVTGGSEGIGGAAVTGAADAGATVFAVARGEEKLRTVCESVTGNGSVVPQRADLSLQGEVLRLLDGLQSQRCVFDVVVNNVGIMRHKAVATSEGLELSFATSLLNHYLLVRELIKRNMLSSNAAVIEVSSGGMYNHSLVLREMNNLSASFEAKRAYGLNKRGQVVMTAYWREVFGGTGRQFYAMHPGWCDTAAVQRDMPTFRRILSSVLRSNRMGADTIVWLASVRPKQVNLESIWFDRKERSVHIYPGTRQGNDSKEALVDFLESRLLAPAGAAAGTAPVNG
jgi:dehydrogenase/reductase SDR family protein 12